MNSRVERKTVDLSPFPDLVVIYLGMRVNAWTVLSCLALVPRSKIPSIRNQTGSCCMKILSCLDAVAS